MKKIFTLLFGFAATIGLVSAQNVLGNGSLETWAAGKALPWDFYAGNNATVTYTQEQSIVSEGASAVKVTNPSGGTTANISQFYEGSLTVGDQYEVSFDYYVVSGDETDVRIWSGWKKAKTGSAADIDIKHDYGVLRVGSDDATQYNPSNIGQWTTYKVQTTVPAGAVVFDFRVRSYKGSVVIFDNFSLVNKSTSGINDNTEDGLNLVVNTTPGFVNVNTEDGQFIEVYNVLGSQLLKVKSVLGVNEIPVQAGQVLIVKVGNQVRKVVTK